MTGVADDGSQARRCGARTRKPGNPPCVKWPINGTKRCGNHGGKAPQTVAKAQRDRAESEARKALGRLNIVPVDNPLTELQHLAGEAKAWKELLAGYVAELERLRYGGDGGEQIRGEIILFERAIDRCATILTAIARLNIDERLVRVSERQVEIVAEALTKTLADMGMSQDQQREARRGVARHLHAVAG